MSGQETEVLVVGAGQAGLAMSEHLSDCGVPHLVFERYRIAERWRSQRWDSLVANGPAWHDRFPGLEFPDTDPDAFASKEQVADYLAAYAEKIAAPIRCGVEVTSVRRNAGKAGFRVQTSDGTIDARFVVVATGPFQQPVIPPIVPGDAGMRQIHSSAYRNPEQLPAGNVLVVGAGSSGVQIADELRQSGRRVFLSVGPHDRPPRRYRGRDFCWWLGVLGLWDAETPALGAEHVTIAVSGAHGGHTVDFRALAARGITLAGRTTSFDDGTLRFAPDLAGNIAAGDASYLALLDQADAYIARNGLDLPEERQARVLGPDPQCVTRPLRGLDLAAAGVTSIIWATGFTADYSWLHVDAFDENGKPRHRRGVSSEPGVYFLGLPWLSRRGSSFIWGVWHDAKYLADHITTQRGYLAYRTSREPVPAATGPAPVIFDLGLTDGVNGDRLGRGRRGGLRPADTRKRRSAGEDKDRGGPARRRGHHRQRGDVPALRHGLHRPDHLPHAPRETQYCRKYFYDYIVVYMKTVIDLDDEALELAAKELGTTTKKDTVNAALEFVASRRRRIEQLLDDPYAFGVGPDITDPEIMRTARR